MTTALRVLLFSIVLGTAVPAVAETITFDEVPLYTLINGQTIKGVLFSFVPPISVPTVQPEQAVVLGDSVVGPAVSNLTGNWLLLPGEFSYDPYGVRATLTLNFLNGPVNSLSFQFAVSDPNCHCDTGAGSLDLFDSANLLLGSTYLGGRYNPLSHADEGTFAYSGAPVSRAVLTVANLVNNDTTPIIDTITFQATPEPGTMFGVASALIGLAVIRRNRHR